MRVLPEEVILTRSLWLIVHQDLAGLARVKAVVRFLKEAVESDRALFRLQSIPGKPFEGTVTRSAYALDPKSRTLRVEIDLANPAGKLHPGLYAYASIIAEEHTDALTIPTTAVGRDADKPYCVVVRDGHASRRPIEPGLSDGTSTEVVSGLNGDELVVKAGVISLLDGQPVESTGPASSPSSPARP